MYWRLHPAVFGNKIDEAVSILLEREDTVQLIYNNSFRSNSLLDVTNLPTLALTTLQDARELSKQSSSKNYTPLLYYNEYQYCVSYWLSNMSPNIPILNRRGVFLTSGMLPSIDTKLLHYLTKLEYNTNKIFIRPNSGNKLFAGQSINIDNWEYEINRLSERINPESLVILAPHVELSPIEWRFWIVKGTVVAYTPYSWEQDITWTSAPDHVLKLAQLVASNTWQLDTTYVVDIVVDTHNDAYVNEINATSTSGTYDAPLRELLLSLRSLAIEEYNLLFNDEI